MLVSGGDRLPHSSLGSGRGPQGNLCVRGIRNVTRGNDELLFYSRNGIFRLFFSLFFNEIAWYLINAVGAEDT